MERSPNSNDASCAEEVDARDSRGYGENAQANAKVLDPGHGCVVGELEVEAREQPNRDECAHPNAEKQQCWQKKRPTQSPAEKRASDDREDSYAQSKQSQMIQIHGKRSLSPNASNSQTATFERTFHGRQSAEPVAVRCSAGFGHV